MKVKKVILGAAVVVVGLPVVMISIVLVWISVLDRTNGTIVSSDETRKYLLYVPSSYDPATATPLVISMHAGVTWPAHLMNLSRWNRLADENGFIVVYPAGSDLPGLPLASLVAAKMWHSFDPGPGLERDVRFISALIDTLRFTYDIDSTRIYANGMSNGGGMAFVLSCTLSDRIAAVGLVAAAQSLPGDWCKDKRPVPMMAFHGDADRMVPYAGGPLGDPLNPVKPVFPAVRDWVARWAERNRCAASPVESTIAPDVVRLEYPRCADNAAVVLFTLLHGGHTWPGGKPLPKWWVGATNTSIDATRQMWTFFLQHSLERQSESLQ